MTRRIADPRDRAEAAFRQATTKALPEPLPKTPSLPGVKELVSLRIDRDVLDYFQDEGPGWQDRINAVLRRAAGKKMHRSRVELRAAATARPASALFPKFVICRSTL